MRIHMGKLHKSIAVTIWSIFIFLLLQFVFFSQYYKDIPKMEKEISHMHRDVNRTQDRINMLKQRLTDNKNKAGGEEHARSVYMMKKKDEKLYKYLDL